MPCNLMAIWKVQRANLAPFVEVHVRVWVIGMSMQSSLYTVPKYISLISRRNSWFDQRVKFNTTGLKETIYMSCLRFVVLF